MFNKLLLLYRGTRDGFCARDFHSKNDGHSNTLTVVKTEATSFVFGDFNGLKNEDVYYKLK
jgi:hypothetical protein